MDDTLAQLLHHFQFTNGEAMVYSALILHGPSSAAQLSAQTSMHRTNIYDIVEGLHAKGFVSQHTQKGVTIYAGTDPNEFLERCMAHQHRVENLIPRLRTLRKGPDDEFSVELHHGIEGLHLMLQQMAASHGPVIGLDVTPSLILRHPMLWQACTDKRELRSAEDRLIVDEVSPPLGGSWRVVRTAHTRKNDCAIFCFGTTVCHYIHGDEPAVIMVANKDIAETFRKEFAIIWDLASSKKP
ncbi:TPA: hypothetical protein HA251_02715 [Candidatus Woesearchaeota archaeon]|nr:hypothetical protein [Candidatus Woesearchaeota archaeon]